MGWKLTWWGLVPAGVGVGGAAAQGAGHVGVAQTQVQTLQSYLPKTCSSHDFLSPLRLLSGDVVMHRR